MGKEFTGESAFVAAYSEYFDVVYREAHSDTLETIT